MKRKPHTVETPIACKQYGGIWHPNWRICVESDGNYGGCVAPTKGVQFCWRAVDLYEDYNLPEYKGKYFTEVLGFNLRNDDIIWDLAEWDADFYPIDSRKDAVEYGREIAFEITSDILRGRAEGWMLSYVGPGHMKHTKLRPFVRQSVVRDDEDVERFEPFRLKHRGQHVDLKK